MFEQKSKLVSGLGTRALNSLRDCIEQEIKYLFCGSYSELRARVKQASIRAPGTCDAEDQGQENQKSGANYNISQHYLNNHMLMLGKFFVQQLDLPKEFLSNFRMLRLRTRRVCGPRGTTFLLQLKGNSPEQVVIPDSGSEKFVSLELSTEISEDLYQDLTKYYSIGSVTKTRYLLPLTELNLVAEIDFVETYCNEQQPKGIITADVPYSNEAQRLILLNPQEITNLKGFMPIPEGSILLSALRNAAIKTANTSKTPINLLRAAGASIW